MILLTTADFAGFYVLNLNTESTPILEDYILRYEKRYILDLLGNELGLLFIADLANVSQAARFAVIEDEFDLTLNGCDHSSRGMKDFLAAAVLYEYTKDRQARATDNGVARSVNEAQTIVSPLDAARFGANKFNEALDTAEAIQWYCTTYADATYPTDPDRLYPEYNGKCIEPEFAPFV